MLEQQEGLEGFEQLAGGKNPVDAAEQLVADEPERAAFLVRSLLAVDGVTGRERERLERALEKTENHPVDWREAVLEWAEDPCLESWRELLAFAPPESLYDRLRNAWAYLQSTDVDRDLMFRCLADGGVTPDVQQLVATGDVSPDVVARRADDAPVGSKGIWFAMAAHASLAQHDELGVVRWLRRAYGGQTDEQLVDMYVVRVWAQADDELRSVLEGEGLKPSNYV